MKNLATKTIKGLFMIAISVAVMTSCSKYRKYDDNQVIEDTYSGTVEVTSTGADPAADFLGTGNSGTYSFAWNNTGKKASLNFDITSPTGSVQFILNDKKGKEVLNETLYGGSGIDSYSGLSAEGKAGMWKVTMILTDFNGDGSYDIDPAN